MDDRFLHQALDTRAQDVLVKDLFAALLGKRIGYGVYRTVYEHRSDPKLVVKVETEENNFCNIYEESMWALAEHTDIGKQWLAPVHWISPNGRVLIQSRTQPCRMFEMPKKIPAFLKSDTKLGNWGWLDDRIVCHDYAGHRAETMALSSKAMRTAKWWDS